ncbi:MAG: PSD1 and planctomycete cytochrome C domain-containing protein [Planctomycetota bacterium]|nr:PSD1 and planctomycete cytochrome C domain-containing protein [Planctomycetota bacterium]
MFRILSMPSLCIVLAGLSVTRGLCDEPSQEDGILFEREVFPILKSRCGVCHFGEQPKGGLDLSRRATIIRGGQSGPAIRIAAAETSLLFEVLSSNRMPLRGPRLTAEEKGLIRRWINDGAKSESMDVEAVDEAEGEYAAAEYNYWSFQPPQRPDVPLVKTPQHAEGTIDLFLLQRLEKEQLQYAPAASRTTLIRRLYMDLVGLPPSPAAVRQFLADRSPTAYEELVDRLLASPQFGERWSRHWLDVAGYSDSAGVLSSDEERQLIWRYRDYVIRAMNRDLPYDTFIREQLAGDELSGYWEQYHGEERLSEEVVEALDATGFLRTGPDASRPDFNTIKNVKGLYYYPTIDAQLNILTSALMGITVKCAKCHNHKFDPLTQREYYRLQSILMSAYNPDEWVPFRRRNRPIASRKQVEFAEQRAGEIEMRVAGLKQEQQTLQKEQAEKLYQQRVAGTPEAMRADVLAAIALAPQNRNPLQKYLAEKFATYFRPPEDQLDAVLSEVFADYKQAVTTNAAAIAAEQRRRVYFDYSYATYDVPGVPHTPLLRRGDAQTPGPVVQPGVPGMIRANVPFSWSAPAEGAYSSGRRSALAEWLTQPRHPLTARVIVNRLWLHHFGEGILSTVDDFGWAGEDPTHRTLLDWLAVELEDGGWSLKQLHRRIVTSAAYRQRSSDGHPDAARAERIDPQNRLLWRQNLRRLEAEPLRDSILAVSGGLLTNMFGRPIPVAARSDGEVVVNDGKLPQRRSIYLRNTRSAPLSILQLFDQPDIETNCARRSQSTVPLQALSLMNSDIVSNAAIGFASVAVKEAPADPVSWAFEAALSRQPDAAELSTLKGFVAKQTEHWLAQVELQRIWEYGYCGPASDEQTRLTFTAFPHFGDQQWQLGVDYPYQGSFWAGLHATGGHPGAGKPVALKWTAPTAGVLRVKGRIEHPSPGGNGIRTRFATRRQGVLQEWVVAHGANDVESKPVSLQKGEEVLLITDMKDELTSDGFHWSFDLELVDGEQQVLGSWNSQRGFHGPGAGTDEGRLAARQKALVDLCHVLLSSHEFSYVD